jgi:hypothetical protein
MKKVIFLLLLLLSLANFALADTNIIELPDTIHTNTHTLNGSLNGGTPSNVYDENFSSAYGSDNWKSDGGNELYLISEHTFSKPVNLSKISYRLSAAAAANGKYTRTNSFYMYVEYKVDGIWHELSGSRHEGGGGEGNSGFETGQVDYNTTMNNVQGLRATIHSYGLATGGEGRARACGWIYELQGWGVMDIGLRAYDGTNIVKIACEPEGILSSPLRVTKSGKVYSIVLVDPSDPRASKVRIKISSAIKALVKI